MRNGDEMTPAGYGKALQSYTYPVSSNTYEKQVVFEWLEVISQEYGRGTGITGSVMTIYSTRQQCVM